MQFSAPRGGVMAKHKEPIVDLGTCYFMERTDQVWQYLKAGEALTRGMALQSTLDWFNFDNAFQTAAAGTRKLTYRGTGTVAVTNNFPLQLLGLPKSSKWREKALLFIDTGTGDDQVAVIHRVYDRSLDVEWLDSEDGGLTTAISNSSDFTISGSYRALKTTAENIVCIGFVQHENVALDEYFWALVEGQGFFLNGAANVGVGQGFTVAAGGAALVDADAVQGRIVVNPITASAADEIGWGILHAVRIGKVPFQHEGGYNPSYKHPGT